MRGFLELRDGVRLQVGLESLCDALLKRGAVAKAVVAHIRAADVLCGVGVLVASILLGLAVLRVDIDASGGDGIDGRGS